MACQTDWLLTHILGLAIVTAVQLNVRRGAEDGDYVEFIGQGHQTRDCSPGDVRFVFRTSHQHTLFQTRLRKTIKEVQLAAGKRKPFMATVAKSLEPSVPFVSLIRSA
jgi:hypothetical protein